jgi:phosphonate transport system substrate-binding protein
MNNHRSRRAANIRRLLIGLLFVVGVAAIAFVEMRQAPGPYIDFNKVEDADPAVSPASGTKPLRLAISSVLSPKDSIIYYRQIADYISHRLERPVVLIQRQSYAEVGVLLAKGGADLAFFSSGAYASLSGQNEIELLAMQQRNGSPYYRGYIIVPRASAAESLADLRGKTFAFSDPLSYSGYIALAYSLETMHQTPDSFFRSYTFTYSHDKSLRAVANNVTAGATVNSLVYDYTQLRSPELIDAVKIIGVSEAAGTEPVVVRRSLNIEQKTALRQLFLSMHEEDSAAVVLGGLHIDRFLPPQPELYDGIRTMLREVRRDS